jgi:hypothetical protein
MLVDAGGHRGAWRRVAHYQPARATSAAARRCDAGQRTTPPRPLLRLQSCQRWHSKPGKTRERLGALRPSSALTACDRPIRAAAHPALRCTACCDPAGCIPRPIPDSSVLHHGPSGTESVLWCTTKGRPSPPHSRGVSSTLQGADAVRGLVSCRQTPQLDRVIQTARRKSLHGKGADGHAGDNVLVVGHDVGRLPIVGPPPIGVGRGAAGVFDFSHCRWSESPQACFAGLILHCLLLFTGAGAHNPIGPQNFRFSTAVQPLPGLSLHQISRPDFGLSQRESFSQHTHG